MLRVSISTRTIVATACVFGFALLSRPSHGQLYAVKELKPLSGGTFSTGVSMNASGVATGGATDKADTVWAALWGAPGATPSVWWGAGNENYFNSINATNDTAGKALYYGTNTTSYPILASGPTFLFLPTPGYNYGEANCISDQFADKNYDGNVTIVGSVGNGTGTDPSDRAVAWKKDGTMIVLDTLPGGESIASYNAAYSIDRYGLAGGSSAMQGQPVEQAVIWGVYTKNIATWLNDPARDNPGIGGAVRDIRDDWYFAGYYFPTDIHTVHACYWDGTNTTLDIGALYGGSSTALAVRNHNSTPKNQPEIVGWSDLTQDSYGHFTVAFVWDPVHQMRDLNKLIPANTGWKLDIAFDVDPQNRIVGVGELNGQTRGFMLVPITIYRFLVNPSVVKGGATAMATLTLKDNVPSDIAIILSSSSPYTVVPRSVTIPRGQQSVRFAVQTRPVRSLTTATFTARLNDQQISTRLSVTP